MAGLFLKIPTKLLTAPFGIETKITDLTIEAQTELLTAPFGIETS